MSEEIKATKLQLFHTQILSTEYSTISNIYFMKTSYELKRQTLGLKATIPPTYLAYIGMIFAFISQWLSCISTVLALQILYLDTTSTKLDLDNAIFFYQTAYLNLYINWQKLIIFQNAYINQINIESDFVN